MLIAKENNTYLTIFECLPLPVFLLNEENRIEHLNHAAVCMFSRTAPPYGIPEKPYGDSWENHWSASFTASDDFEKTGAGSLHMRPLEVVLPWIHDDLQDFLSSGSLHHGFRKSLEFDGSPSLLEVQLSRMFHVNGSYKGTLVVLRDVTELLNLKKQLHQSQKMEVIGTLAGGIAHDFNNILGPILGYTEMGLADLPAGHPVKEYFDQIFKAGSRAKELVKQILTFSRQTEQVNKPVRISLVMKEALKLLKSTLPSTIVIHQDISAKALTCNVLGDPTQIHQVLVNLCTNAAHAMRENGGRLEVSLLRTELDSQSVETLRGIQAGSHLELCVKDTGHGMDDEVKQRIFEPYFTTKGPKEGTGLGLAVVYGIVERCGGAITVSSEPGEGTVFQIFLPIFESMESQKSEAASLSPGQGELILLVDDEETLATMTKRMLERLGYRVEVRCSAMEALEAFQEKPDRFDLVLTDYTMPHMTGLELGRKLLHIRPELPLVLCTGFSEMINEEKARSNGIKGFLMKPLIMSELAELIRRLLTHAQRGSRTQTGSEE